VNHYFLTFESVPQCVGVHKITDHPGNSPTWRTAAARAAS
jgi:hypothetical protein